MSIKTDAIGRRLPATPQPKGLRIVLSERDRYVFYKIETHGGPLPTDYVCEFAGRGIYNDRLTKLFNEGFLIRDPKQFPHGYIPRNTKVWYELSDRTRKELYTDQTPDRDGAWWWSRAMTATISASTDLAATKAGLPFKPAHRITGSLAATVNGKTLIPDDLFSLTFGDKQRFYFREDDRSTEQIAKAGGRKTIEEMLDQYLDFIPGGKYKTAYDIREPGTAVLLLITTNETRKQHIMGVLADKLKKEKVSGCNFIWFKSMPHFHGRTFEAPPIMWDILDTPFDRVGLPPITIGTA